MEVNPGDTFTLGSATVTVGATDHRPVEPTVAFRIEVGGTSAVLGGDGVPCAGLDELCRGADAYVQTVIRDDLVKLVPNARFQDILDYHSHRRAGRTDRHQGRRRHARAHALRARACSPARRTSGVRSPPPTSPGRSCSATTSPPSTSSPPTHHLAHPGATMQILRTPDDRFVDLPDFPFEPHYAEIAAVPATRPAARCACTTSTKARRDAAPVLLMHGEPSWSFLYRHMIPVLVAAGHRVVVPDLVGFGSSDKPAEHHRLHVRPPRGLDAASCCSTTSTSPTSRSSGRTGVASSGCALVAAQPERFARVVVGNTGLPEGDGKLSEAFLSWQKFSRESPVFPIGDIVNGGCASDLSPEVIAGYDAPFPDDTYKAGARIFPSLVPSLRRRPGAAENREAWKVLEQFDQAVALRVQRQGRGHPWRRGPVHAPQCPVRSGQPHTTIVGGGHFLQEDKGAELAEVIAEFIESDPSAEGSD